MKLDGAGVLLVGANGGIGQATAHVLAQSGVRLVLAGMGQESLDALARELPCPTLTVSLDLGDAEARQALVDRATDFLGSIELLVNVAGILEFVPYELQAPEAIERTLQINTIAPMLLIRAVLPAMIEAGRGRIANVGSMFGSIGFPYFSAYSASKFALRGFCEALRRELAETGVGVTYISPRATRTPINTSKVMAMAEATGMNMDLPELVAKRIVEAIEADRDEAYVGQPESLFARLNGLLPGVVGRFLGKQRRAMEPFARA